MSFSVSSRRSGDYRWALAGLLTVSGKLVTSRERFHRTMAGQDVDRPPLWGDGLRREVREGWATQGYPLNRDPEKDFAIERREQVQPDILHREYDLTGGDFDDPQLDLQPDDPHRYPDDWSQMAGEFRIRDYVVGLRVSRGLFQTLGVRGWDSLSQLLYRVADDPDGVARYMLKAAKFALEVLQRALDEVQPDYILFSEPIASNAAPVVGPATFRGACAGAYAHIIQQARRCGVRWAIFESYGHVGPILTEAMAMGMDAYWGRDTVLGSVPYRSLRKRFGHRLALIGGIDVGLLQADIRTAADEMRRIIPPLVKSGRYIPLLDGRVRSYMRYKNYAHYRRTLVSLVEQTR